MQARRQLQELSAKTSLTLVKSLLLAGFACIARDRELFPEDNFMSKSLAGHNASTANDNIFASQSSEVSSSVQTTGMRVTWLRKGHTPEADKLMEYLEHGVFDALEKRYLKTFIFAIYLDKNRPTDIVETYTFDFSYVTIPGTDLTIPVMNLGDQMSQLSLRNNKNISVNLERPTTLGEAKRSIKTLLKRLMVAVQQFDTLPTRRYATFKIFYTEDTPENYEPPGFHAGDYDRDRFVFKTHSASEEPEEHKIGMAHLGHHAIEVRVASIACFLPCKENRDAVYAGVTAGTKEIDGVHTPEAARLDRAKEYQIQKNDAEMRRTTWLAEGLSAGLRVHSSGEDADGEADPDYYSQNREDPWSFEKETPLLDPTQVIDTQVPSESRGESLGISLGIDTMDVQRALVSEDQDYSTTQVPPKVVDSQATHDTINSFSLDPKDHISGHQNASPITIENFQCSCGVLEDNDGLIFCEGGCEKWFHVWCMGYQSPKDKQIPSTFFCLECRLGRDAHFETLRTGYPRIYEAALSKYQDLCLFRRSIKSVQQYKPKVFVDFKKVLGGEPSVAVQMWKRLQVEGFIVDCSIVNDGKSKNGKGSKKPKKKVLATKQTFELMQQTFRGEKMKRYFTPQSDIEAQILGLQKEKSKPQQEQLEEQDSYLDHSQTQQDQDMPCPTEKVTKRRASIGEEQLPRKKNKISLAPGVDLET